MTVYSLNEKRLKCSPLQSINLLPETVDEKGCALHDEQRGVVGEILLELWDLQQHTLNKLCEIFPRTKALRVVEGQCKRRNRISLAVFLCLLFDHIDGLKAHTVPQEETYVFKTFVLTLAEFGLQL